MSLRSELKTVMMLTCVLFAQAVSAQTYAPAVGQAGTSAMHKDSSAFVNWANGCKVTRGYQDVSNTSLGVASVGDSSMATAKAQTNGIVSLGDGGSAICTFAKPVMDGSGYDFAVFENGFDDTFLELAVVEVSSDGINFTRFRAHSLTDTVNQTSSFGPTDPTKINNLAGKYRGGYGTPFDLAELAGKPNLNINAITYIKIIDVVGSVNALYATRDAFGNKINDPWPTAFPSGGFDLDAVGVIHENTQVNIRENDPDRQLSVYPNPLNGSEQLNIAAPFSITSIQLLDVSGKLLLSSNDAVINIAQLGQGLYLLRADTEKGVLNKKIVIN